MTELLRTVGRYQIVRKLGRGGMATVYLARQPELDRAVALKELHAFHADDDSVAKRFVRESRVSGSLSHPNIVMVFDYFEHEGTPYIAMEYLEPGSLRAYLPMLNDAQRLYALEGVLGALKYAEHHAIVHRDLKPENVLVTSEGGVKLADFGIAKATRQVQSTMLTGAGLALGTPGYMAPEQAMGQPVGPWTDLYSVGCMAFEMFTGRLPFHDSESPMALLLRHLNETIPSAVTVNPAIDPAISDWIAALLAREHTERIQSAAEAWEQLEDIAIAAHGPRWHRQAAILDVDACGHRVGGPFTPPPNGLPIHPAVADLERRLTEPTPAPQDQRIISPHAIESIAEPATIDEWITVDPIGAAPSIDDEAAKEPVTVGPVVEPPLAVEPVVEEPSTEQPASEEPPDVHLRDDDPAARENPVPVAPPDEPYEAPTLAPRKPLTAAGSPELERPRHSRAPMILFGALVAAAIVVGAIMLRGGSGAEKPAPKAHAAALAAPVELTSGAIKVDAPPGARKLERAPSIEGLDLVQPAAAAVGSGTIFTGFATDDANNRQLLPLALVGDHKADGSLQMRDGFRALRYDNLRPDLTVYASPTSNGVAVVGCQKVAGDACVRAVQSTTVGAEPFDLGPDQKWGDAVDSAIQGILAVRRSSPLGSGTAERRAKPATRVSAAYRRQNLPEPGPADQALNDRLNAALNSAAVAYSKLADATKSRSAYNAAAPRIESAERKVQQALETIKHAGYGRIVTETLRPQSVTLWKRKRATEPKHRSTAAGPTQPSPPSSSTPANTQPSSGATTQTQPQQTTKRCCSGSGNSSGDAGSHSSGG